MPILQHIGHVTEQAKERRQAMEGKVCSNGILQ